ncbi:MAG: SDR family oxidoreductase [Acidobacteriota bacterium]
MKISAIGCVVTGASEGIGRAVAQELGRRGCRVALVARRVEALEAVRAEVEGCGGRARAFPADVTDDEALGRAVDEAADWCDGLRLAVVNAGIGVHGAAEALSREALRRVLDVNLIGAQNTIRAVLPHLRQRAPSALVAVASLAGLIPYRGGGAYGASKAALIFYLRCLRLELAGLGVSVGWLCPGPVATRMIVDGVPSGKLPRLSRALVPVLSVERVAREVVVHAGGRGGGRVIPATAAFFATFSRLFPRLSEWTEVATGAGEV